MMEETEVKTEELKRLVAALQDRRTGVVCEATGISEATIVAIKSGTRKRLYPDTLKGLQQYFKDNP